MSDKNPSRLTVVDLFSGVGGISQGFMKCRGLDGEPIYDVRLLVDTDKEAANTFKSNYPSIPFLPADVAALSSLEIRKTAGCRSIDVLVGGPPCQGFSLAGKRDLSDKRNALVRSFFDLVVALKPRAVLMENVPTLLGMHGAHYQEILKLLSAHKYQTKAQVLQATDYGVPQIRRRAFIFALRRGIHFPDVPFPPMTCPPGKQVTTEMAIGDLPPLKAGEGEAACSYPFPPFTPYQVARRQSSFVLFNHTTRKHTPDFLEKISIIPEGGGNRDLDPEQQFSDNYFSQAYARLHRNEPAYTITAHFMNPGSGRFLHYRDRRSISVREAARLQSFDDHFVFHGTMSAQARHVGNAVPPLLAKAWGNHIARTLGTPVISDPIPATEKQARARG
jgi:DNA (cytosine-5)-methyltransferase 1